MSEEKLYVVKNDEGEFLSFSDDGDSVWGKALGHFETDKQEAISWVHHRDGHVVTLIEEPEKVVLTKEQAEIVEGAHDETWPATYISFHTNDEELLMNAYVNGYTVKKEKKYMVELDGLVTTDGAKQYLTKEDGKWFANRRMPGLHQDFTDEELNKAPEWAQQLYREEMTAEIERNGLQDCERMEVIDVSNETKRWYVKTPDNWMGNEKQGWLYKITGIINTLSEDSREHTVDEQFTAEEIKKYHLDGFEKEEVTGDEQ